MRKAPQPGKTGRPDGDGPHENPYLTSDGTWAFQAFASVKAELHQLSGEVQRKLTEAWDHGARSTEARLRDELVTALRQGREALQQELADRLVAERAARDAEIEERLAAEHRAALAASEARVSAEVEARLRAEFQAALAERDSRTAAEVEQRLSAKHEAERVEREARLTAEVEARLRAEQSMATDEAGSYADGLAEGYARGTREAAARMEELLTQAAFDRRTAVEEALKQGYAEGADHAEVELKAAHNEGYKLGLKEGLGTTGLSASGVSALALDEAKRQGYENGYEDGRSVGVARGRRASESEGATRIQEAARKAYQEGFLDGKRVVGDADRAWAFGVLHLHPGAEPGEIKQRYKRLGMLMHPDQNPGLSDDFIKNLNRARELLDA